MSDARSTTGELPRLYPPVCAEHRHMAGDVSEIKVDVKKLLSSAGVTEVRLRVVEKVVYGAVAVGLIALGTGILSMVIRNGN